VGEIEKCLKLRPWKEELYGLFILYLRSGGFPRAVKDILEKGKVSEETYDTYLFWIRGI